MRKILAELQERYINLYAIILDQISAVIISRSKQQETHRNLLQGSA